MRLILNKILFICCLCLILTGCTSIKELFSRDSKAADDAEYAEWTAEKFRTEAKKEIEKSNYEKAIKHYQALETRYPFGLLRGPN